MTCWLGLFRRCGSLAFAFTSPLAFAILLPFSAHSQEPPNQQIVPAPSSLAPREIQNEKGFVSLEHIKKYHLGQYVEQAAHWEKEIAQLSEGNLSQGSKDSILFLGSSSIRLWESIDEDLPQWRAVRRGYGGAKFCDLAIFAPNLVRDLKFRAAAIFVANDIVGNEKDKSAAEVARLANSVVESVRAENPHAPILIISITATPSRFPAWEKIDEANRALQELASGLEGVHFLDTKGQYLDSEGKPLPRLFSGDMLHQNRDGYRLWGSLVGEKLIEILSSEAEAIR